MKQNQDTPLAKRTVFVLAVSVILLWLGLNANTLCSTQHGFIRCTLTLLFAVLIAIRPKPTNTVQKQQPLWLPTTAALFGVICLISGLIIPILQLEWIGLLLLLFACLTWALPSRFSKDIPLALLVLYWITPLPSPWFGNLQIGMQIASVRGSEWFLHIFNIRAWADGLVLRTGQYIFEVPAWCSGMRTATTVVILSLALGILRRLRWHETILFMLWSLFHALVLNILRICTMVAFAARIQDHTGLKFLHDTAGVIVILGVAVVYFEMLFLERRKQRRLALKAELKPENMRALSEYPPFWHNLHLNRIRFLFISLLIIAAGILGYRSRPYHRAMMLQDVAVSLRDKGELEAAQRVASIVRDMIPNDIEWLFTTIRLHLIRGQHEDVLNKLNALDSLTDAYLTQKRILKAYALMSLNRIDEAAEIVKLLPEHIRKADPRVAMILAEMALRGGDSDQVAIHITIASGWAPNVGRIRNLYPYLRIHRQWGAMSASDINIPYSDPTQAFSILEAYMNLNRVPKVADITLQAIARWPYDMRVLEPLFFMALNRNGGEWESRFGEHLLRAISTFESPDRLFETLYKCFALNRPDLAWAIYRRIETLDPNHPTLAMSIAKYGSKWFAFKKRRLGMPSNLATDTLNLKPFFLLAQLFPKWETITANIPAAKTLCVENATPVRKQFLEIALKHFKTEDEENKLSLDMQYLYTKALEMSGRVDLARRQLETIVTKRPEEALPARVLLSEIYERKGDWINVYETLRTYLYPEDSNSAKTLSWPPTLPTQAAPESIHLNPLLRLVRAQLELRLNLAALHTAQETLRLFPYSPRAIELLAGAYLQLGEHEMALHRLGKSRTGSRRNLDRLEANALLNTERYNELAAFCRGALLPKVRIPPRAVQQTALPPAELSLLWHRTHIPAETEFLENAAIVKRNLASASTGLRKLMSLWLSAYEQHCAGELASPAHWEDCGRDPTERAMTLNQLTLLLCREGRYADAQKAAQQAVSALPTIPILWEILISLSGADSETVKMSRTFCPNSPELWLAELVANTHSFATANETEQQRIRTWLNSSIDEALENKLPPATLTRAGEFLWRGNLRPEATRLAEATTDAARGLLPCHILAIRCALNSSNDVWALSATEKAIESALNPLPEFYINLVSLKSDKGKIATDPDMVNALRNLRKSDPTNPLWPQMLGYVRFQRGGWEIVDAMFEMNVAIAGGETNRMPFLIASEVSRLLHDYDRAADILTEGLKHNPGHPALMNNLAYTLSHTTNRITEAVSLISDLEHVATDNPKILDTIAVVYIRAGKHREAQAIVRTMLTGATPGSTIWFRASMHLAEIAWKEGRNKEARAQLEGLLKSAQHIPDEDILIANALLTQIMGENVEYLNPMRAFVRDKLDESVP